MKIAALVLLLMVLLQGCSGAQPRYSSDVLILVERDGRPPPQSVLLAEAEKIEALASPLVPSGATATAAVDPNVRGIRITVMTPDANEAAVVCSRVAEAYLSQPEESLDTTLLTTAGPGVLTR